jgi:hypothetical protein
MLSLSGGINRITLLLFHRGKEKATQKLFPIPLLSRVGYIGHQEKGLGNRKQGCCRAAERKAKECEREGRLLKASGLFLI